METGGPVSRLLAFAIGATEIGNIVPVDFTGVLAKHSKSFSLIDSAIDPGSKYFM